MLENMLENMLPSIPKHYCIFSLQMAKNKKLGAMGSLTSSCSPITTQGNPWEWRRKCRYTVEPHNFKLSGKKKKSLK